MLRQMMKRMISGMGREVLAELRTLVVSFVDLKNKPNQSWYTIAL